MEKDKNIRGIPIKTLFKIIAAPIYRDICSATFGATRFSKSCDVRVPHSPRWPEALISNYSLITPVLPSRLFQTQKDLGLMTKGGKRKINPIANLNGYTHLDNKKRKVGKSHNSRNSRETKVNSLI